MRYWIVNILFISIVVFFNPVKLAAQTQTTDLRGQVVAYNVYYGTYFPAQGIRVDLLYFDVNKQQWYIVASALTDSYGMYYFFSILPGQYYLQVNGVYNYSLWVYTIDRSIQQYQEIPVIQI